MNVAQFFLQRRPVSRIFFLTRVSRSRTMQSDSLDLDSRAIAIHVKKSLLSSWKHFFAHARLIFHEIMKEKSTNRAC